MKAFLLFFILVVLGELYLLIELGGFIGGFPTILLIIITAFLGIGLMKSQGLMVMQKVQSSLEEGVVPKIEMLEGVLIFVGGVFLFVPGLIGDAIGLLFLIQPVREFFAKRFVEQKSNSPRHYQEKNVYETEWQEKPEVKKRVDHKKTVEEGFDSDKKEK